MSAHLPAKHPVAEVFGFPAADQSAEAKRHRTKRLCPFNNKVPNCTKDKAQDPLGVCSVAHQGELVITCPIRFRQGWRIADDAAEFYNPPGNFTTASKAGLGLLSLSKRSGRPRLRHELASFGPQKVTIFTALRCFRKARKIPT